MGDRSAETVRPSSRLDAVRAFGVMSGGPAVFLAFTASSIWRVGGALVRRRFSPMSAILELAGLAAYLGWVRPCRALGVLRRNQLNAHLCRGRDGGARRIRR